MSNKRQLGMSAMRNRVTSISCCDLKRVLGVLNFVTFLLLLLTSTKLIVESAKLETKTITETFTKSTQLKATIDVGNDNHYNSNNNSHNNDDKVAEADEAALRLRQQHKHNTLDEAAENFYHKELQRLSYDTIHSILRDENEPIFRREDNDRRYYHAKSLQPTHEIMKRAATEEFKPSINTTKSTIKTNHLRLKANKIDLNFSAKSLKTFEGINSYENLAIVNLSHNQLSELPQISSNSNIILLDLNSNHIQTAKAPLNAQLKALYLSDNQIENLASMNLSQLLALETLDLSCNHIKNLETSFFPQLMHNLKFLNLAHNHLGTISRETFFNLLSLNTLLLAHNNITNIDYETFLSLPNLQYLDLSHNQLKGESIRALQGIPDLIGLSIAYNPNMGESLQEFVASWSLKEVDASGTGLCQIPAALAQAVRTLKLADNWLKIINCGDLDSYPLLTHLDLSNCHIEDIEDDAMGRLEFLELLFLDHNKLRKVPVSLPTSLEHLFLQNNEIMDLQMQAFQGLKNLRTLDLSHNKLLYLPALPLPKLLTLNLQASGLQGLNQAIVHSLPQLRDLLLEENPIKCSDLLGIAEWASPCRIADRVAMLGGVGVGVGVDSKSIDKEQIANSAAAAAVAADVGQKQQQQQQQTQTVAKIDLKAKFVLTHNFYEKFAGSSFGVCNRNFDGRQTITTLLMPPTCAIEFEDEVMPKVEKPTMAKNLATEQPNVNFNERHKLTQVEKSTTTATAATNVPPTGFVATTTMTAKSMVITENANHAASIAKMPTTKSFQTENAVIANVTSTMGPVAVAAVMPTTISTINSIEKTQISQPKAAEPTIYTKTTTATSTLTSNKSYENALTNSPNLSLLLPATMATIQQTKMSTKMPTKMPTSSTAPLGVASATTKPIGTANGLRSSLLERQRRLEATTSETLLASSTKTTTKTATTASTNAPVTHQAKNLARNIDSNDSQKMLQRKSSKNFENSNNETKNRTASELLKMLPKTTATITVTTTTIVPTPTHQQPQQQHKHVTLQLNSKDRHLIGTPLLTHHGQNLMVAAEELKKNGNHITAKTSAVTTNTTTTLTATATTTAKIQKQPPLDRSQNKPKETEINEFSKNHEAENGASSTATNEAETTTTTTTATMSNVKLNKKQLNEQKKKPTTLIMKKMTITTTATKQPKPNITLTTNSPKIVEELKTHHHYTLNTPHENEATLFSNGNSFTSVEQHQTTSQAHYNYQSNSNVKHHSTVNTPVINGHENEPQTFQEHNEIEEAAAAVAARASISAKFNSKLHGHDDEWSSTVQQQHKHLHFDNPTVVFIVGIALFVTLVLSLLHAYRCKMPAILNMQRQQQLQRPHRQHSHSHHQREQQGQQMRIRNSYGQTAAGAAAAAAADDADEEKDIHSFLNGGSNQFQRQWRLERAYSQQQQEQQSVQQQQPQQQQQQKTSSPFHNLQVRELQQTSAVEPCPRYCKPTYNISSALGERSNSHTSSSCSPHSSCTFDDETCYIEMTTDVGQPIAAAGSTNASICHGELLPMELLSAVRHCDFNEVNAHQQQQKQQQSQQQQQLPFSSSQALHSFAFQTSTIDEAALTDFPDTQEVTNTKLTPRTRKLGLW